jgi:hypothetical protein
MLVYFDQKGLQGWSVELQLFVQTISFLQQSVHCGHRFFPVFIILNGVHSTAWLGSQSEVKLGIFAETTSIAQEWIFLIIIDRSALVTLEYILSAVSTDSWVGGY